MQPSPPSGLQWSVELPPPPPHAPSNTGTASASLLFTSDIRDLRPAPYTARHIAGETKITGSVGRGPRLARPPVPPPVRGRERTAIRPARAPGVRGPRRARHHRAGP